MIAIVGGIGSGKSVVCKTLACLGFPVYDCDSRAKALMDNCEEIKSKISTLISPTAIIDGKIQRQQLAQIVFNDAKALTTLNSIVHTAVREDLADWAATKKGLCFFETAILRESGLDRMVDEIWVVEAPEPLRVARAMARSHMTRQEAQARVDAQQAVESNFRIINDDLTPILPQIQNLLNKRGK